MKTLMYKGVPALKTCPEWLKIKYRQGANHICQNCNKHEKEVGKLQPHRICRATHGGLYTVCKLNHPSSNVKMLCDKCHKLMHSNEQGCH